MKLLGIILVLWDMLIENIKGFKFKRISIPNIDGDKYVFITAIFIALYLPLIPMVGLLESLNLFVGIIIGIMAFNIYAFRSFEYFFGNLLTLLVGFLVGGLIMIAIAGLDEGKQIDIGTIKINKDKVIINDDDMYIMTNIKDGVNKIELPEECALADEVIVFKDIESLNYLGEGSYSYGIRCEDKPKQNLVQEITPLKGK